MSYNKDYLYDEKNGVALQPLQDAEVTEKTCLQQPTKQQLSWEEKELQEDELHFKDLTVDEASVPLNSPPDIKNLVYLTFLIHGIGVLMPWNMFITANEYFTKYKFSEAYIGFKFPYLPNFMQYLTFSSQVPSVLFNWMNIFVTIGGSLTTRIVWSIIIEVIIFIITVILAMVDSETWPYGFFYVTIISVVVLSMANGIYQNSIYGMAAKLPGKYTGAVILGNNICGTFTAIVSILSKLMTSNTRMAAIYYFVTALLVLGVCFGSYFTLQRNRFYKHFEQKEKKDIEQRKQLTRGSSERPPYLYILKKCLPQLYNVFFVFFVTLAVFPTIHSDIKPMDENFFISQNYYADIMCFVTFNVCAMIGSWLPSYFIWPKPKYLWIPVTMRVVYIPFYLFCNYQVKGVERILPVLVTNDWVYWIGAVTMGISNGYFSSLAMMYTPRMVEERYAATAGMFAAAALITGIFTGIVTTFLWPLVIANVG